jgi:hypothetical protein
VVLRNLSVRELNFDDDMPALEGEVDDLHPQDSVLGAAARRALIERHFS